MRDPFQDLGLEPLERRTQFRGESVTLRYGDNFVSAIGSSSPPPAANLEAVSMVFSDGTYRWVEMPREWRQWDDERLRRSLPQCRMAFDPDEA